MQIAVVAAGFSPGEADQVRRSMASWQRQGRVDCFREKLMHGMRMNGYSSNFSEAIYRQILGFGSYGFPESHAASFARLVYVSAWLKCHYPAAFCAALLNSQPMGFYNSAQLVSDARRHGVRFEPVDVGYSDWDCTLETRGGDERTVRLGLRLIAGLPESIGVAIVNVRRESPFTDINDLAYRAALPRNMLRLLSRAGALASLSGDRHAAHWQALGVEHLPGFLRAHSTVEALFDLPRTSEGQEVVADYEGIGLTLGRHPVALLRPKLDRLGVHTAQQLYEIDGPRGVRVAGVVTHRQRPGTAFGVLFMLLEDETGTINLIVKPGTQCAYRSAILRSSLMMAEGELQNEGGVVQVVVTRLRDCSRWLGRLAIPSRDFC